MTIFEGYLGEFNQIQGTAGSNLAATSVVTKGPFVGVTHEPFKSGETYTAFMPQPVRVYGFTLAEAAGGTISVGTPIYITSAGKATTTASSNTYVGVLWQAAASGDTVVAVALLNNTPTAGIGVASSSALGLVKTDGSTIDITSAGVISVHGT